MSNEQAQNEELGRFHVIERPALVSSLAFPKDPSVVVVGPHPDDFDAYMPFGPEEAQWKAALLRCHDSQHQRNLHTRGHGFNERILAHNRLSARELGVDAEYVEVFELEYFT